MQPVNKKDRERFRRAWNKMPEEEKQEHIDGMDNLIKDLRKQGFKIKIIK